MTAAVDPTPGIQAALVAVVYSDEHVADIFRFVIARLGCAVQVFDTGEGYLAAATSRDADVVLVDTILSGMPGHQV
jgi:FixJ family two-component response regulator